MVRPEDIFGLMTEVGQEEEAGVSHGQAIREVKGEAGKADQKAVDTVYATSYKEPGRMLSE